jgi:hypothetical protein
VYVYTGPDSYPKTRAKTAEKEAYLSFIKSDSSQQATFKGGWEPVTGSSWHGAVSSDEGGHPVWERPLIHTAPLPVEPPPHCQDFRFQNENP